MHALEKFAESIGKAVIQELAEAAAIWSRNLSSDSRMMKAAERNRSAMKPIMPF
jgi:hypothetical protein